MKPEYNFKYTNNINFYRNTRPVFTVYDFRTATISDKLGHYIYLED